MQTTRHFVAFAVAAAPLLGACTGGDDGLQRPTPPVASASPARRTPVRRSATPGVGTFTYENVGVTVRFDVEGSVGTLEVDNRSGLDLDRPDIYVVDAVDGHEIAVDVRQSAPVADGDTATFDVSLGEADVDQIGLLVLLFGTDNYGAFVRTG
jgi:hypothetical protein